jgi:hypothetical protein
VVPALVRHAFDVLLIIHPARPVMVVQGLPRGFGPRLVGLMGEGELHFGAFLLAVRATDQ